MRAAGVINREEWLYGITVYDLKKGLEEREEFYQSYHQGE